MIKIGGKYPVVEIDRSSFKMGEIVTVVRKECREVPGIIFVVKREDGDHDLCYDYRLGKEVRSCPMS